ncbi:zincin-like metallopeptidase domain-containing protein [Sporosarcina globispora]|uniref:zincin-like metallopeptidase domain-containing protein n=1 Tax=Sporosarcina globispora TaxID=1459 RepID=UPI000AD482D2|nr:zincin-like metallopeptidase domain-containing protein [Sporosarcina globispora]
MGLLLSGKDEVYSKEELVAEMGAAMLCGIAGIDNSTIENSASYIHSWIRNLK